jgi:hypothetical protein
VHANIMNGHELVPAIVKWIVPRLNSVLLLRWAILAFLFYLFGLPALYLYPDMLHDEVELKNELEVNTANEAYWNYFFVSEPYTEAFTTGALLNGKGFEASILRIFLWSRCTFMGVLTSIAVLSLFLVAAFLGRKSIPILAGALGVVLLLWLLFLWLTTKILTVRWL